MEGVEFPEEIEIEVGTGPDRHIYIVDPAILTCRSRHFKQELSENLEDLKDDHIWFFEYHEHESATFELYIQCACDETMEVEPDPVPEDYEGAEERVKLIKVYLFAEEIEDALAMNIVTEALLQSIWKPRGRRGWIPPHPGLVDIVWRGTARNFRLRQMVLDVFAHVIEGSDGPWEAYPKRFLADLVGLLWKVNRERSEDREHVLQHGDSADKYLEEVFGDESEDEDEEGSESEDEDGDEDEDSDEHQALRRPSRLYH